VRHPNEFLLKWGLCTKNIPIDNPAYIHQWMILVTQCFSYFTSGIPIYYRLIVQQYEISSKALKLCHSKKIYNISKDLLPSYNLMMMLRDVIPTLQPQKYPTYQDRVQFEFLFPDYPIHKQIWMERLIDNCDGTDEVDLSLL